MTYSGANTPPQPPKLARSTIATAVGLALPMQRGNGGYFASKSQYAMAFSDLVMALMTPVGSRPGLRAFGSNLNQILFGPISSPTMAQTVDALIRGVAAMWVSQLVIISTQTSAQNKVVNIKITFALASDRAALQTQSLTISNPAAS